jgi:hypothetical protein
MEACDEVESRLSKISSTREANACSGKPTKIDALVYETDSAVDAEPRPCGPSPSSSLEKARPWCRAPPPPRLRVGPRRLHGGPSFMAPQGGRDRLPRTTFCDEISLNCAVPKPTASPFQASGETP